VTKHYEQDSNKLDSVRPQIWPAWRHGIINLNQWIEHYKKQLQIQGLYYQCNAKSD